MTAAARYTVAMDMARPKGTHLLEGFSPKLGRRITLYRRAAFDLWLLLEADPHTTIFCERPTVVRVDGVSHVVDFWVRSGSRERFIIVGEPGPQAALEIDGTPVTLCYFNAAEREANRAKISNIERMLPTIATCRELLPGSLLASLEALVKAPMPLGDIERQLHPGEPTPVRAAVFKLLLAGRLLCPELATTALSSLTVIEPAGAQT